MGTMTNQAFITVTCKGTLGEHGGNGKGISLQSNLRTVTVMAANRALVASVGAVGA